MPTACVAHAGSAAWERLAEALALLRPRFGRVPEYPADDPGDAETLAAELAGPGPGPSTCPGGAARRPPSSPTCPAASTASRPPTPGSVAVLPAAWRVFAPA